MHNMTGQISGEAIESYLSDAAQRSDAYDLLKRMREDTPVFHSEAGPWMVLPYQLVQEAAKDSALSREAATEKTAPLIFNEGPALDVFKARMSTSDGERHRRLRRHVSRFFTPNAVNPWRSNMQAIITAVLDAAEDHGKMEVVSELAYPLPERLICEMLGVPYEDHKLFEEWSLAISNRPVTREDTPQSRVTATAAMEEFASYLRDLVAKRSTSLTDDLLSQLIMAEEEGERLSELELIALLTEMIEAGHDTTASLIASAVLAFMHHRDQWDRLCANPLLAPQATEEILRCYSPVHMALVRVPVENLEIGGCPINAGEVVIANWAAANRDPAVFDAPDAFDIGRLENRHLSFGFGEHFCLGANLARAEVQEVLRLLATRFPNLRLETAHPEWRSHGLVSGPKELLVALR